MIPIKAYKVCHGLVQLPLCFKAAGTRHEHMPLISCWLATTKVSSFGWARFCLQNFLVLQLLADTNSPEIYNRQVWGALFEGLSRLTRKANPADQEPRPFPQLLCIPYAPHRTMYLRLSGVVVLGDAIMVRGCCITGVSMIPILRQSCYSTGPVLTPVLTPVLAHSWHSTGPVVVE